MGSLTETALPGFPGRMILLRLELKATRGRVVNAIPIGGRTTDCPCDCEGPRMVLFTDNQGKQLPPDCIRLSCCDQIKQAADPQFYLAMSLLKDLS